MARRAAEVAAVAAFALVVTLVMAAPVLRAPSERIFGMAIVGRHHDPFTVMAQFERPISVGLYSQPVTDIAGALLARVSGAVAAYNWLVLLSFPLSAAAAYLLARYLTMSRAGATVVALAYAFSPFHLAQAAYHPHIAQTQWVPLYLFALWWCLDKATFVAIGVLGAATLAVTLSNFYGGFIAAVITPIALAAYWLATYRAHPRPWHRLGLTVGSLVLIAAAGVAYASYAARAVVENRAAFAFPRVDLFFYSANWWSYLVPPVEHPLLGAAAQRVWTATGVRDGLLEQQVYLGWGIVALGLIAVVMWLARDRGAASRARVPVLVIVGIAAFVCSLSPEWTIGALSVLRPSGLLYGVAPMFRSYARFGVVVQLMAVLLAGIAVDALWRAGTRGARLACLALVALAAGEYVVAPSSVWRDVLPTTAHRWITQQPGRVQAFDCAPLTPESGSVPWLTGRRVTMGSATTDCTEPGLSDTLAANGFTHLVVRRGTADGRWFAAHANADKWHLAADFGDGQVFAVAAPVPVIYTVGMNGFFPREHDAERSWRWMGSDAAWTIGNTSSWPIVAALDLELSAFDHTRRLEVLLDGRPVQTIDIEPSRRIHQVGPLTVTPGPHQLLFHPADAPTVAADVIDNGDLRPLSFWFGTWRWTVQEDRP